MQAFTGRNEALFHFISLRLTLVMNLETAVKFDSDQHRGITSSNDRDLC